MGEGRRRPRTWPWMVGLLGLVLVLGGALVAGELLTRGVVQTVVEEKIHELLGLPATHPIDIELDGVSVLAQLTQGRLAGVTARISEVELGELEGDVALSMAGIPVDLSKLGGDPASVISGPVELATIEFTASEESVAAVARSLTASLVQDVRLDDGLIRLDSSFEIIWLGDVALGMSLEPYVGAGVIGFSVVDVSVNNDYYTVDQLRAQFGSLVDTIVQPRELCLAEVLPMGVELSSIHVLDEGISLIVDARGLGLDADSLLSRGSCS